MPGAFPQSASPGGSTPTRLAKHISNAVAGGQTTPKNTTPIRPSMQEMHPQKHHMTTAKPLDEARWLGFSSMVPQTEPPKGSNKVVAAQDSPTKMQKARATFEHPPEFQFTFNRPSLGLGPEARQMMAEKREEAAKIREQMMTTQESNPTANDLLARKMATPKGKVGRFSDVHMSAFKNMDSIANHPSAFRADGPRNKSALTDSKTPKKSSSQLPTAAPQSLKRTQSKLDLNQSSSALPRATSKRDLHQSSSTMDAPAKRVKRAADDDTSTARPSSSSSDAPSTPKDSKSFKLRLHPANSHFTKNLGTPTTSSLSRASSVKSVKRTMIPAFGRSPSKPELPLPAAQEPKAATPLLARSPSKMALPATSTKHAVESQLQEPESPLLSRSPVKQPVAHAPQATERADDFDESSKLPYLARSPSKKSFAEGTDTEERPSKTPLLARSPSKIAIPDTNPTTPGKSNGTNLMARFNLLRQSPIKSILRTPQRLYSNDPSKIASGTHLATPDKPTINKPLMAAPPKTAPVQKHVDFSASTKGPLAKEEKPETPSKKPSDDDTFNSMGNSTVPPKPTFSYPSLPTDMHTTTSTKKNNRRMTMGLPSDFTFRVGGGISFAPSPARTEAAAGPKASIRHVSAEPEVMSASTNKRKFSGLDNESTQTSKPEKQELSDKENGAVESEDESRPAKKARTSATPGPSTHAAKQVAKTPRKTTLGVKPKSTQKSAVKDKRPGGPLSRDRLNALAMPKKR